MKNLLIIIFFIINPVFTMEQPNWLGLPGDLWPEIVQFVIGDGQDYSERLRNCKSILLTCKQWHQLMQTNKIQNRMKKYVYAEVENLCKPEKMAEDNQVRLDKELNEAWNNFTNFVFESFDPSRYKEMKQYNTPLEKAIEKDKLAYIYFHLKDNPEKLNDPIDASGNTMLHIAARFFHHRRIFNFLLSKESNVDIQNGNNETPLHEAAIGRKRDDNYRVLQLKEKGANLYIRNDKGMSPLDIITEQEHSGLGLIPLGSTAHWDFINQLIPEEHKFVLDIQSVSDHSQLLQLHQLFGPEELPSKLSVKRKR